MGGSPPANASLGFPSQKAHTFPPISRESLCMSQCLTIGICLDLCVRVSASHVGLGVCACSTPGTPVSVAVCLPSSLCPPSVWASDCDLRPALCAAYSRMIAGPCPPRVRARSGSQFLVSRARLLGVPGIVWANLKQLALKEPRSTAQAMEHLWHVLFGEPAEGHGDY